MDLIHGIFERTVRLSASNSPQQANVTVWLALADKKCRGRRDTKTLALGDISSYFRIVTFTNAFLEGLQIKSQRCCVGWPPQCHQTILVSVQEFAHLPESLLSTRASCGLRRRHRVAMKAFKRKMAKSVLHFAGLNKLCVD
jgi:hypothetical protein